MVKDLCCCFWYTYIFIFLVKKKFYRHRNETQKAIDFWVNAVIAALKWKPSLIRCFTWIFNNEKTLFFSFYIISFRSVVVYISEMDGNQREFIIQIDILNMVEKHCLLSILLMFFFFSLFSKIHWWQHLVISDKINKDK